MILNLLNELKGTIDQELKKTRKMMSKQIENIAKETENIKINQIEILECKSTILEMKISLEGFNNRFKQKEESINKLEDSSI